jgi:hypothetical protein
MDPQIAPLVASAITGVCAITAATAVALINLKSQANKEEFKRLKDRASKLRKDLVTAYGQIAAYHILEEEYTAEMEKLLASSTGEAGQSIKIRFRDRVVARDYERPSLTANKAQHEIMREKEYL